VPREHVNGPDIWFPISRRVSATPTAFRAFRPKSASRRSACWPQYAVQVPCLGA